MSTTFAPDLPASAEPLRGILRSAPLGAAVSTAPLVTPVPIVGMSVTVPRAAAVTDLLLSPLGACVHDSAVTVIRSRLLRDFPRVAQGLRTGVELHLGSYLLRSALGRPDRCSETEFIPNPLNCRRAIGLAGLARSIKNHGLPPAAAVANLLTDTLVDVEAGGHNGSRLAWWARWYSKQEPAVRAVVQAEATTWATEMYGTIDWSRFGRRTVVGGPDDWWRCPTARHVALQGRAEIRTWVGGRQVQLVVSSGYPTVSWRAELAFPALVAALGRGIRATPARVVGLWPDTGQVRVLPIDLSTLNDAAEGVTHAVGVIAAIRSAGR